MLDLPPEGARWRARLSVAWGEGGKEVRVWVARGVAWWGCRLVGCFFYEKAADGLLAGHCSN